MKNLNFIAYKSTSTGKIAGAPIFTVCVIAAMLISFPFGSFAQNNEHNDGEVAPGNPGKYYSFLMEGGIELTYPVAPLPLRQNFNGVYGVHYSISQDVFKGLYAGIELQSSMASAQPPIPFPIATAAPNMYLYNGAVKLTYCTAETGEFLFSFSLAGGDSWIKFNNIPGYAPPSPPGEWYGKNIPFYSGRVMGGYKANDQLCLSLEIAYTGYLYSFDPAGVGILQVYSPSQSAGHVSFFQWGFGIEYLFGKAK